MKSRWKAHFNPRSTLVPANQVEVEELHEVEVATHEVVEEAEVISSEGTMVQEGKTTEVIINRVVVFVASQVMKIETVGTKTSPSATNARSSVIYKETANKKETSELTMPKKTSKEFSEVLVNTCSMQVRLIEAREPARYGTSTAAAVIT